MAKGKGWLVQPVTERRGSDVAITIEGQRHVLESSEAALLAIGVSAAVRYGWAEGN